jgi:hypothetical protein
MLSDWELWAISTYLEEHLGNRAPHFITERMVSLTGQGDEAGVTMWQGVLNRYEQLQAGHRGPLPI